MPDLLGRPQDNEGKLFVARARTLPFPDALFFGHSAALLQCPDCRHEEFRIACSTDNQPFIQIACKCGKAWMPMEMRKASMTNKVAQRMGIKPAIEEEFETPDTDETPYDLE